MSTKTNERRLKITPGKAEVKTGMNADVILRRNGTRVDFGDAIYHPENAANAALYADAHNTANEVDMLPSELLAKLREAVGLLEQWVNQREGIRVTVPESRSREFLSNLNLPKP